MQAHPLTSCAVVRLKKVWISHVCYIFTVTRNSKVLHQKKNRTFCHTSMPSCYIHTSSSRENAFYNKWMNVLLAIFALSFLYLLVHSLRGTGTPGRAQESPTRTRYSTVLVQPFSSSYKNKTRRSVSKGLGLNHLGYTYVHIYYIRIHISNVWVWRSSVLCLPTRVFCFCLMLDTPL